MSNKRVQEDSRKSIGANRAHHAIAPFSGRKFTFEEIDLSNIRDFGTFQVHDHICQIYNSEQQRQENLLKLVSAALDKGERVTYVADENLTRKTKEWLVDKDKKFSEFENSGQISFISNPQFYDENGLLSPELMISYLGEQCKSAKADGYSILRIVCDMGAVTKNVKNKEKVIEFEEKLNSGFLNNCHCINVCQYDREQFPSQIIRELFNHHPYLIKGIQVYQNFYYSPPEPQTINQEIDALHENLEKFHVTQSHAIHNSAMLMATLNSISEGISILSPDLVIQKVNSKMNEWYKPNLPLEGKKCYRAYHNKNHSCDPCPSLRCLKTGKTEIDIVKGLSGSVVEWIELSSHPIKDPVTGEVVGVAEFVKDITQRVHAQEEIRRNEQRLRTLALILQYSASSLDDFLDYALAEAIKMTESAVGHIYYYDETTEMLSLCSWSEGALAQCNSLNKDKIRKLETTGIWGEVIRQRKPLVLNDFQAPNSLKRGLPKGHIKIKRYLSIPVFERNHIVALIGIANKETDYTETDLLQLTLLMQGVWKVVNQKKAEFELHKSEEKYRTTLFSIGDGVIVTDTQGFVINMNKEAEKLTGWSENEAIGVRLDEVFKIVNEESGKKVENPVEKVLRQGVVIGLANHTLLIAKDGTKIPIADSGAPVRDASGNITGVVLVFRDQIKEREAQKEIEKARQFAESIIETIHEPLIVLDDRLRVISANRAFYEAFAETPEHTEGQLIFNLGNKQWDIPELRDLLKKILPQNTSLRNFEINFKFADLGERIVLLNAHRIYQQKEKTEMILLAVKDITEQKMREKEISRSLKEKSVLLSEIHHRVKNNLNLVVSLLNLQARQIQTTEEAIEAFQKSKDRIYTMALVHEKLYQSQEFSSINMKTYFEDLLSQLKKIYDINGRINIRYFGEDIYLNINQAIPCALILNELISNAIKHAFPDELSGQITIYLKIRPDNTIVIICQDTGVGLPETVDIDQAATLGLQLVKILTDQLDGRLTIKRSHGTEFEISFPGEKK